MNLIRAIARVFSNRNISVEIDQDLLQHIDVSDRTSTTRVIPVNLNRLILNIGILKSRIFASSSRLKWFDKAELIEKIHDHTNELRIKIEQIREHGFSEDLATISEDLGVGISVSIAESLFKIKRSTIKKIHGTGRRPDWECQTVDNRKIIVEAKGSINPATSMQQEVYALEQKVTRQGDVRIASMTLLKENQISTNRFLDPPIDRAGNSPTIENHILRAGHYALVFSFLGNIKLSRYYSRMRKRLSGIITPAEQDLKEITFRELETSDPTVEYLNEDFVGSFYHIEEQRYFFVGVDKRLLSYQGFMAFSDYENDIESIQDNNHFILMKDGILIIEILDIEYFSSVVDIARIENFQERITISDIDDMTEISLIKYFIYLLKENGFSDVSTEKTINGIRIDLVGKYNNVEFFFEFKIRKDKRISMEMVDQLNQYSNIIEDSPFVLVTNADVDNPAFTNSPFKIIDRNGLKRIGKDRYELISLLIDSDN